MSSYDENIYAPLEKYNTIFSIDKDMAKEFIDSRNDSLSALAKIYYYFYPLIDSEANAAKTPINQTFFIAYEVNETKEIQGKELYFNFPRITDDFIQNNNFFPYNNLISPRVSNIAINETDERGEDAKENEIEEENEENEEEEKHYINDNWFLYYDNEYRISTPVDFEIKYFHLNENNRGSINKTNVLTMHSYLNTVNNYVNKINFLKILYFS